MLDQETNPAPVIVPLPTQIDLNSQERAYDRLYADFVAGASVVVADFTATTFCDCSSLRHLVNIQSRPVARNAQLQLAIPPGSQVHRVAQLTVVEQTILIYSSPEEAALRDSFRCPEFERTTARAQSGHSPMADIIDVISADHLHIMRWAVQLGELRRQGRAGDFRAALVTTWATLATLIDLHMRADDEICGPKVFGTDPEDVALAREHRGAHEDIRGIIRETSLQPPGSPLWWDLARTALAA